jgi:hypothetical protein
MLRLVIMLTGALTPGLADAPDAPVVAGSAPAATRTDADALVGRALWAESRGLFAERRRALESAVQAEPDHPRARALLGQVADGGRWVRPGEAAGQDRDDPDLAAALEEYRALRAASSGTAGDHRSLARWCERRGLAVEARAHLTAVTRLEPEDDSAWRRLGYRRSDGRWVTPEQEAAEAVESLAQARADRAWHPRLATWKVAALGRAARAEALEALDRVRDPRAVPSVLKVFDDGSPLGQVWAVRLLGHIGSPQAAQGLARLAVFGRVESVRRGALDRLTRSDPRTFVGLLINFIREPIRYEATPGIPGVLVIDNGPARVERRYEPPPPPEIPAPRPGDRPGTDTFGRPVLQGREVVTRLLSNGHYGQFVRETTVPVGEMAEEARRAAADAVGSRIAHDVRAIERENYQITLTADRAVRALTRVTGRDLGRNQETWTRWWTDQLGYRWQRSAPAPEATVVQSVATPYLPRFTPAVVVERPVIYLRSCFGAGTPVSTRSGLSPIEKVEVGDVVLSQDTATGALAYRPVVAVFHNRPAETLRVSLEGGEELTATGIHRFWRAGSGWVMARDLVPGDRVRTLGGTATVAAVRPGGVRPVYNLEVDVDADYFVGSGAALVHDNTLVPPTPAPFDAIPPAEASGPGG